MGLRVYVCVLPLLLLPLPLSVLLLRVPPPRSPSGPALRLDHPVHTYPSLLSSPFLDQIHPARTSNARCHSQLSPSPSPSLTMRA